MQVSKRLTSKSGITIPKSVRTEAGFVPGMAVDIQSTADGGILIRKHTPSCRFCGGIQQVACVFGIEICKECARKLDEELKRLDEEVRQYGI